MSNHVHDEFRRWAPRMNAELATAIQGLSTFLVPKPSAMVIRSRARQVPPSLDAVSNALIIDDQGAVAFLDVRQEVGEVVPATSLRVNGPASPTGMSIEPMVAPNFKYRIRTRFVVFQAQVDENVGCMWAEGECYLGDPVLDHGQWRSLVDTDCDLDKVRYALPSEHRILSLAEMCAESGASPEMAYDPIRVDLGSAIATGIEQLDFVRHGCHLRQGSRGQIVLPEVN